MDQFGDLVVDLAPLAHQRLDLLDGVDDGGVVAATELPGDGRVRQVGELAEHVHGDLAGGHQGPTPALALQVLDREVEHVGGGLEDHGGGDGPGLTVAEDVLEVVLGLLEGERLLVQVGDRCDPIERPLELADVVGDVGGDNWHIRHLTGAMAESIERLAGEVAGVTGKLHWLLGGMAAQMTIDGETCPSPEDGEGKFDEFLVNRMKVIAGYPESDFNSLLGLYFTGRGKLQHLFHIEFSENGIVSLPKGGEASSLPPARFPVSSCLTRVVLNLVGVSNESGI